jgi:hypothetical protein
VKIYMARGLSRRFLGLFPGVDAESMTVSVLYGKLLGSEYRLRVRRSQESEAVSVIALDTSLGHFPDEKEPCEQAFIAFHTKQSSFV